MSKQLKILITVGIFPPEIGGPATYVPHIAAALTARGHMVTVVAPQEPGVPCPIENPPYRLVRYRRARILRYLNYSLELWRAFWTLWQEAASCDVVYINGLGLPATLAAGLRGKPTVVKVVGDKAWEWAHGRRWTTLNLDDFQGVCGWRESFLKRFHHWPAYRAQVVLTPSYYMGRVIQGWGVPKERVRVVYNALIRPETTGKVTIPEGFNQGYRLLMVGRMIPLKRIGQVISLLPSLGDVRLVLVGSGPLRAALSAIAEKVGVMSQVFFAGQLSNSDVWALLENYADVLVLNSVHETFPHILLEAACCGVPVVATDVGGTSEIVLDGETGFLVSPDAPEDLLAALLRLRDDIGTRQRLSVNARQIGPRFSFEQMVEKTENALGEVAR